MKTILANNTCKQMPINLIQPRTAAFNRKWSGCKKLSVINFYFANGGKNNTF